MNRLTGCLVIAALIGAPASGAWAAPSQKELAKARARFQQATELEQAGNYTQALEAFREVGQVRMTPQVRYHIGVCEEKLGKLLTALGGYELALQEAASVDPSFAKEVEARIVQLKARIPKLTVKRGESAKSGRVEIDGVAVGEGSLGTALPFDPGPRLVEVKLGETTKFSESVTLAEGDSKEVVIEFAQGPVSTDPAGPAPVKDQSAPAKSGRALPWIIGGIGVAGLAAGGVFFVMKNQRVSELEDACGPDKNQCPPDKKSTYDDAKTYNTLSMVGLGVGVVGLGVATTMLLTQKSSKPKAGYFVTPAVAPGGGGVAAFGRF
ncbi:MAG: tetratricopeptide repeat protein [Polyangiaceae bacterium]|nr:tetratricopeptide repeat protein [Polyangiaceae bacterium]